MKPRLKISLLTSNEGHFSISEAIRETLETTYEVSVFKQNIAFNETYKIFYRLFPSLFAIPFRMKYTLICLLIRRGFFLRYRKKLIAFLESEKPDLCLTSYGLYITALEWYQQVSGVPFINIVSDPLTIHPISFATSPTLNVTFDEASFSAAEDCDFPITVQPWGWFVRDAYEKPYNIQAVRKALGLKPGILTFLLAGGSEGSLKISELLPHLLKTDTPIQIIVACGSNRLMLQQIKLMYSWNLPPQIKLVPLGFTNHLERYMQAADLIVGKAGPNVLFEAVATHTPFFAITHISGQEDGNLEIIKKYQLGYVEENISEAATMLQDIIRQPRQLEAFQTQLQNLAAYNHQAKKILMENVKKYLLDNQNQKANRTSD